MWVVLVLNNSGTVLYAYVYSSLANATAAQVALTAALIPGQAVQVFQTPATDTVISQGTGGLL